MKERICDMKTMKTRHFVRVMKGLLMAVLLLSAFRIAAQTPPTDTLYRQVYLGSVGDSVITVYRIKDNNGIVWGWFKKAKETKPKGELVDSCEYLLVKDEWMRALASNNGDLWSNGMWLQLNGVRSCGNYISNSATQKPVDSLKAQLKAELIWEQKDTVYIINDSIKGLKAYDNKYEKPVIKDNIYLIIKGDHDESYRLVVNNTDLLPTMYYTQYTTQIKNSETTTFGLCLPDTLTTVSNSLIFADTLTAYDTMVLNFNGIRVIPVESPSFYINEFRFIRETKVLYPPIPRDKPSLKDIIVWIVLAVVVLALIAMIIIAIKKNWILALLRKKRFEFNLSWAKTEDFQQLKALSKGKDMDYKNENYNVSFEVNSKNAGLFSSVDDKHPQSFLGKLSEIISASLQDENDGNKNDALKAQKVLESLKRFLDAKLQKSKEEDTHQKGGGTAKAQNNTGELPRIQEINAQVDNELESLRQRLKVVFERLPMMLPNVEEENDKQIDLEQFKKDVDGLFEVIKSQKLTINYRQNMLGKDTPEAVQHAFEQEKAKIQLKYDQLEKEFNEFKDKLKEDPESFNEGNEYKKLKEIIEDADIVKSMLEKPDVVLTKPRYKNSSLGEKVNLGVRLEEWLEHPEKLLNKDGISDNTLLWKTVDLGIRAGEWLEDPNKLLKEHDLRDKNLWKTVDLGILAGVWLNEPLKLKEKDEYWKSALGKKVQLTEQLEGWKKDPKGLADDSGFKNTELAKKVQSGIVLDRIKDDALKVLAEDSLNGTDLQKAVGLIGEPEKVVGYKHKDTGLFKLVDAMKQLSNLSKADKQIDDDAVAYPWLKEQLATIVAGYNDWCKTKTAANALYDSKDSRDAVEKVLKDANSYKKFLAYQNYWLHIIAPLKAVLDKLEYKDEKYNTRALLYYASQFYSIACIMNKIYGKDRIVSRAELNVKVFQGQEEPAITQYGFPETDANDLETCRYQFGGTKDDITLMKYLSKYSPLPFILVQSYFDEKILEQYKDKN